MNNERLSEYLLSLEPAAAPEFTELRVRAEADGVPILRTETESFLRTLLAAKKPRRILELGTAVGYSSLVMASASDARIDTVENYPPRIEAARANIAAFHREDRIRLYEGDAGVVLKQLVKSEERYDFIFLDAAKGQYLSWLPDLKTVLSGGGLLLSDNVLQDETVLESRFLIPRRERTTHQRMREFLRQIKHDPELATSILPVGDGVSLSVRLIRADSRI